MTYVQYYRIFLQIHPHTYLFRVRFPKTSTILHPHLDAVRVVGDTYKGLGALFGGLGDPNKALIFFRECQYSGEENGIITRRKQSPGSSCIQASLVGSPERTHCDAICSPEA